jgi:hypothetical protein
VNPNIKIVGGIASVEASWPATALIQVKKYCQIIIFINNLIPKKLSFNLNNLV